MPLVSRPRLADAIERSANLGVALIVAPAGYGKTEAIDEAVGDIGVFVDATGVVDVASAARAVVAAVSPDGLRAFTQFMRRVAGERDADVALVAWISRRLRFNDAPIVLDDFQVFASDPDVRQFITRLIQATIPLSRWIIASRETPELPMGSWIADERMTMDITAYDLEFTLEEARSLANAMEVTIEDESLEQILRDADGWPLVVQLILDAWRRAPALPPVRIRTRQPLFAFFDTEIWARTSGADRELLLAAALAPNSTVDVFEAAGFLTPGTALDALSRRIPLLRRGPDGSFRLHDLFADFIRDRANEVPAKRRELLGALTRAYERIGQRATALQIALRGGAHDLVIEILGVAGVGLIDDGFRTAVTMALGFLPPACDQDPIVATMRALLAVGQGHVAVGEAGLRNVRLSELPVPLARIVALRLGQLSLSANKPEQAIADLAPLLDDEDIETAAEAIVRTAAALARSERNEPALALLGRVLPLLDAVPLERRAILYERIAFALIYLRDYPAAERHAKRAIEYASQCDDNTTLRLGYSKLVTISQLQHADGIVTQEYASRWLEAARESWDKSDHVLALAVNIGLAAESGDTDAYAEFYREFHRLHRPMPPQWDLQLRWARALVDVAAGRARHAAMMISQTEIRELSASEREFITGFGALLWAMAGDYERASSLLQPMGLVVATADAAKQHLYFARAYRALANWIIGRPRVAAKEAPSAPDDLPESSTLVLEAIRSICRSPLSTMTHRKMDLFLGPITAIGQHGHARFLRAAFKAPGSVALTPTELEIFRELRECGGSSEEIAGRVGSSPRTVDSHINNVCRKLNCSGRTQALLHIIREGWLAEATP